MRTVVLVGLRSAALAAAERLGLQAIAVVEAPPGPRTRQRLADVVVGSFDAPGALAEAAADTLRPYESAAVVALTERSVVPAAHLRQSLGLPGLSVDAAVRCTDKRAMKRAIRAAGLACAETLEAGEERLAERLGLPLVLKTCSGSGGRGTRVLRDASEVPAAVPDGWMAEAFVEGIEMSAEQLVVNGRTVWFNPTQYLVPAWASLVPAPLAEAEREAVQDLAEAARQALGIDRGMTHLEAFLTPEGPVFGEMAARPPGGHLTTLIRHAYGFDPWEGVLQAELGEPLDLPPRARQSAAVWIVHPGPGVVQVAEGAAGARELEGVEEVVLRAEVGSTVGERVGTGEEVGHVVCTGATAAEAEARVRAARDVLRVEVAPERSA